MHWQPLTRRNTPLGLRYTGRGPASSRRSTIPASVTRRSDGRSSTPRRQFGRLCSGCRFAAPVAVGWTCSFIGSTQGFAPPSTQVSKSLTGGSNGTPNPAQRRVRLALLQPSQLRERHNIRSDLDPAVRLPPALYFFRLDAAGVRRP